MYIYIIDLFVHSISNCTIYHIHFTHYIVYMKFYVLHTCFCCESFLSFIYIYISFLFVKKQNKTSLSYKYIHEFEFSIIYYLVYKIPYSYIYIYIYIFIYVYCIKSYYTI